MSLSTTNGLYNHSNNTIFKAQMNTGTNTKNCIYLIQCHKCEKQYVGETGNTITTRLYQYKYNITQKQNITVINHFTRHGWSALKGVILKNNPCWSTQQRKTLERHWICLLDTLQPRGLNKKGGKNKRQD